MSNEKKVSLIIPIYNTEKYLRECLDSAIDQNMEELEIICVNDGSTDGSQKILDEYSAKDSRIHIIVQENQGLSCARNTGMRYAMGEYICFLDSDDMIKANAIAEMYKYASGKRLDILCYDAECIYENELLKKMEYKDEYYIKQKSYGGPMTGKEMFCHMIEKDDFCDAAWLMFIRKEWIDSKNIYFVPRLIHEDCIFTFQCYMEAHKMEHIKKDYIKYRIRENSIMTSKASYGSMKGRLFCYTKILEYLLNNDLSQREIEAIVKFEKFIMYNIKWVDYKLDEEERSKATKADEIEKLISASMEVGEARQYGISDRIYQMGFDELLKRSEQIVLYGAGKIGHKVYQYILKKGLTENVDCFAVSKKKNYEELIDGLLIREISEVEKREGILVLICARRDYQESMLGYAKALGFSNIEVIDLRLEQIIDKDL